MTKAKILLICDVPNWAFHHKSKQIKKHLSDEFDIDIIWLSGPGSSPIDRKKYDLYLPYRFIFVDKFKSIPKEKIIGCVTAHRPLDKLRPYLNKNRVAAIVANSVLLQKDAEKLHPKVFLCENGVDEKLFKIITPIPKHRNNIRVGNCQKLSPVKGQKEIIIPAINKTKADYVCRNVKYKDAIPLERMVNIYQEIDVYTNASIEDGSPNPCLESASCGRPIISNHIGNMRELIRNGYNGFLVPRKIEAYVEKIKWMRSHRKEMRIMGDNARKTILEGWTWTIKSENYRKMFRELL